MQIFQDMEVAEVSGPPLLLSSAMCCADRKNYMADSYAAKEASILGYLAKGKHLHILD